MLTRLKVNGFKNLADVDVSFGPFTCVAGANGVGKSNLFDAITFLGALAEKPLLDAALSVRNEGGRASDLRSLFFRAGSYQAEEMSFEAEMLIPPIGVDELGKERRAAATFLRYKLVLGLKESALSVKQEELTPITWGRQDPAEAFCFAHGREWGESVLLGELARPLIWTKTLPDSTYVAFAERGERARASAQFDAERLPRTVLSRAQGATIALARQEMQSWKPLQLEPSALRTPDSWTAPRSIAPNGAHLAATLGRLARLDESEAHTAAVYARVANRLAELLEDVRSVRVDVDSRRELLSLVLTDRNGTEHEARSLSDGTLRFLALAILESDPEARGVLCLEEPENGIHPQRIPAMLRLLQDLAVDPTARVDEDNPLRQVIINTHSPAVAAQVPEGSLLVVAPRSIELKGHQGTAPAFRWLPGTWRAQAFPDVPPVPLGQVISYLNPLEPAPADEQEGRVIDRDDVQRWLPFSELSQAS